MARMLGLLVGAGWFLLGCLPTLQADELAQQTLGIFRKHCHRCHGQEGSLEGGLNYLLDRDRLLARKQVVPGQPDESPLFKKLASGKMPPPDTQPRPSADEIALVKRWLEAGAPSWSAASVPTTPIRDEQLFAWVQADLEKLEKRERRFTRYFSFATLHNAGLSPSEMQTYRHSLTKLLNSLSWSPKLVLPTPVDPAQTLFRFDLRTVQWDANLWNRLLAVYPYGILYDTAYARSVLVNTGTRMPILRADWFLATASRAPLYHDLLQLPTTLAELERQLRVESALNIQQERVARAGFLGSGIAKNNRLLERHDASHGYYWRTYDFEAIPANFVDREKQLPDRRNLFAHPLGPGFTEASFQHAGGEAIWSLPNGLQAYMLVNAVGQRIDKAPTAIVSDPKRPDRAVETGISCMGCHYSGILPKTDQIRAYVEKHPQAFENVDRELVFSLYPPEKKMKALQDDDASRFRKAVEALGGRVSAFEPISTLTLRYEGELDLLQAAAEIGLTPAEFSRRLGSAEKLHRNLGPLRLAGGTVAREVWQQAFADIVRDFQLGTLLLTTLSGLTLPDNTGEIDPLEGQGSAANSLVFTTNGSRAVSASSDRTLRVWNVEAERELRRCVGHTASVWSVALSADNRFALSGSADNTMRLWELETGRELQRFLGHTRLVQVVAFLPDGKTALSASFDRTLRTWNVQTGKELSQAPLPHDLHALAVLADGKSVLLALDKQVVLWDLAQQKIVAKLAEHPAPVVALALSPDQKKLASSCDAGNIRIWDLSKRTALVELPGQAGSVRALAWSPDGTNLATGGADRSVRIWDWAKRQELKRYNAHADSVVQVAYTHDGAYFLTGSRDGKVVYVEREKR